MRVSGWCVCVCFSLSGNISENLLSYKIQMIYCCVHMYLCVNLYFLEQNTHIAYLLHTLASFLKFCLTLVKYPQEGSKATCLQ